MPITWNISVTAWSVENRVNRLLRIKQMCENLGKTIHEKVETQTRRSRKDWLTDYHLFVFSHSNVLLSSSQGQMFWLFQLKITSSSHTAPSIYTASHANWRLKSEPLSIDRSIDQSIDLSFFNSIYCSLSLSVCLSVCRAVYISVYLFMALSIVVSIILSILRAKFTVWRVEEWHGIDGTPTENTGEQINKSNHHFSTESVSRA